MTVIDSLKKRFTLSDAELKRKYLVVRHISRDRPPNMNVVFGTRERWIPQYPCVYFSFSKFRPIIKFRFVVPGRPAVPSNRLMFISLRALRA